MTRQLLDLLRCVSTTLLILECAVAQTTTRATLATNGQQSDGASFVYAGGARALSDDGRWLVFESNATTLSGFDVNIYSDVYVLDRASGVFELVAIDQSGQFGQWASFAPTMTPDARFVAFSTQSALVPADVNGFADVYVRDRLAGTTVCVSVDPSGLPAGGLFPSISADAHYVAFESSSSSLVAGDTNSQTDVFVRDMLAGITTRESVSSTGVQATHSSLNAALSRDGLWLAYRSYAPNLVAGDTNLRQDVFLRDRVTTAVTRVSVSSTGAEANDQSYGASISADGRYVLFTSAATNLVLGDANGAIDTFVHDRASASTTCVSVDPAGIPAGGGAGLLSDDGRYASFSTVSSNIVPGDTNSASDGFLRDLLLGQTERVTVGTGSAQAALGGGPPVFTPDANVIGFASLSSDLVSGDDNQEIDLFVHDRTVLAAIDAYCTAKTNSAGCIPGIASTGVPSFSGYDAFFVTTSHVMNNKTGVFIWSLQPAAIPFGGGTLCVAPPVVRTSPQASGGFASGSSCTGSYAFHFRQSYMASKALQPGATIHGQFWSRDMGFPPPNNIGLTDALQFTLLP